MIRPPPFVRWCSSPRRFGYVSSVARMVVSVSACAVGAGAADSRNLLSSPPRGCGLGLQRYTRRGHACACAVATATAALGPGCSGFPGDQRLAVKRSGLSQNSRHVPLPAPSHQPAPHSLGQPRGHATQHTRRAQPVSPHRLPWRRSSTSLPGSSPQWLQSLPATACPGEKSCQIQVRLAFYQKKEEDLPQLLSFFFSCCSPLLHFFFLLFSFFSCESRKAENLYVLL